MYRKRYRPRRVIRRRRGRPLTRRRMSKRIRIGYRY